MNKGLSDVILGNLKPIKQGKVRNVYDLNDCFLFVATDRISAYDYILGSPIPDKGKILNQLSKFWFQFLSSITETHFLEDDVLKYPESLQAFEPLLQGRSMLVKKAEVIPVECVVRGYISGSAWQEYKQSGTINESKIPNGLIESERLETPIFTPATKASSGHDENIPFEKMVELIGKEKSTLMREKSLSIYNAARDYLDKRGIILADTKFEFGLIQGDILLIDEVLTPDSSRFWPKSKYTPGKSQESYDKQFVRDYLNRIKWEKKPPAPALPEEIIHKTRDKYLEIFKIITGKELE
ncbi:MAG: phosphoribosylaminoimidazolesuccinocarboxamide synthase [Candidatus Aureabacteria bacterium]|nr:phosphoribosylaminoimidazolesuccinocarboxamide synthase [Candidatus Auribacterota bacterium]